MSDEGEDVTVTEFDGEEGRFMTNSAPGLYRLAFFRREDKKWAWHLKSRMNGQIVATDGGQGYERLRDAVTTVRNILEWANTLRPIMVGQIVSAAVIDAADGKV